MFRRPSIRYGTTPVPETPYQRAAQVWDGGAAELVNYRVSGRYMIIDRLFSEAELRIGDRKSEQRVRIRANRRRAMS